jgi:hypothetical protein
MSAPSERRPAFRFDGGHHSELKPVSFQLIPGRVTGALVNTRWELYNPPRFPCTNAPAEKDHMAWQKGSGSNSRSKVEAAIGRW